MNKKLSYIFKRLTFFKEKEIYSNGLSSVTSQGMNQEAVQEELVSLGMNTVLQG